MGSLVVAADLWADPLGPMVKVLPGLTLYVVVGLFWLPVVWMQIRMRDLARLAAEEGAPLPTQYHWLFRRWFGFGFPAFAAVLGIVWLMLNTPVV
ncbi:hypothetical protein PSM7751_02054 [Pseudooceanicola marinus]|uniref:DUF2269 domain-containing protein n=1 Tax=Pseudooceanicola marinus TaxID=396013 RepID=A0A1X6Z9R7_9RHOB|nr:DUF2269 family protein [Pseudooceanicola marinus]PJE28136.1 DUF2269 domain-containing protein [Pseudooceanicola marinus]SLN44794.1 hypothetical protein PSM7751_02054 [Pseudooceanicola marinus]